jgi:hypothetical protein
MQVQELYRELEAMGVNMAALREADLTETELAELADALRRLLKGHRADTSSKSLIDVT